MLIKPQGSEQMTQGKLAFEHPEARLGHPVAVDYEGRVWATHLVEFIIPDDEIQGETVRQAGYQTHTPLTMALDGVADRGPQDQPPHLKGC